MKRVLAVSIYTLLLLVTPVHADTVTIGFGVVADVTVDLVSATTTIRNIQNTTGVTASDFHLSFIQGQLILADLTFSVTEVNPDFRMDAPVPNGGFLTVGGVRRVITINQDVGRVSAFWTDGQGHVITPEPATIVLLGTGLAGVAIKTRKRLKRRKRAQRKH
jgi:PEP-CTERM motif